MKARMDALSADVIERGMLRHPADHFDGKYEVEKKYRVESHDDVRQKLIDLGGEPFMLDNLETDVYFDTPKKTLQKAEKTIIIRDMQPSRRVLWICKGPQADECVAGEMLEYDRACEIAAFMGLVEVLRIQKKRDIFFLGDMHITLDTLDELGFFVEIATTTNYKKQRAALRKQIDDVASALGLKASHHVKESYRQMISQKNVG